jgi:DNA-directed RNA polymerase specialized sigma24 family protein
MAVHPGPQSRVLTQSGLDLLLSRLDPDRNVAGQNYENVRRRLVTFFRFNNCTEAEMLADETIDRVSRRLIETEVLDLMSFISGVARRVSFEWHRSKKTKALGDVPELSAPASADLEDQAAAEKRLGCLRACAKHLNEQDQELILEYYQYEKSRKIKSRIDMAQGLGISVTALRARAFRVRKRLEDCINNCVTGSGR